MPQGTVYVFNATPENVALILNNYLVVGGLAGVSQSTGYQAQSVQVQRSASPDPGGPEFAQRNSLIVATQSGQAYSFEVDIDPLQVQPAADLQLYVTFGSALLITPTGAGIAIQGGQPSAEQMAPLETSG